MFLFLYHCFSKLMFLSNFISMFSLVCSPLFEMLQIPAVPPQTLISRLLPWSSLDKTLKKLQQERNFYQVLPTLYFSHSVPVNNKLCKRSVLEKLNITMIMLIWLLMFIFFYQVMTMMMSQTRWRSPSEGLEPSQDLSGEEFASCVTRSRSW